MSRTHWWMLTAILSLALTGAIQAQCPHSACGGSGSCYAPAPSCETPDAAEDQDAANDEDAAKDEDAVKDEESTTEEAKCTCENCECKDGKCTCKDCKCAHCAAAKAKNCDCAKCECGCEKCKCNKAASAKVGCAAGCCAKSCCAKGSCCIKVIAQTKDVEKVTGESETVHIVLEDLTVNYFGAGLTIKKVKISYKGQGVDAGDMAKDLSSIGRAPTTCVPTCLVPCTPCPNR